MPGVSYRIRTERAIMLPKYKDIIELIKKGSTLEAQEKIMELREAAIELQDENQELRQKIKGLEEDLETKAKLKWEKPYYWLVGGEHKDGPFCQLCYDKDKKLIRLQGGDRGSWRCHSCRSYFEDSTYTPPKVRRPRGDNWMSS
jgi:hypothetical protein